MRILVYEFASGGGFAGRPVVASLAREGRAMRDALVEDLALIGRHEIVMTTDPRFAQGAPPGVAVVPIGPRRALLPDDLLSSVDAVWLIAPETDGCLERLALSVERKGKTLFGPGSSAIRCASDKERLPRRLARCGVAHPQTHPLRAGESAAAIAERLGYPIVVKPRLGAGCEGVRLARDRRELATAIQNAAHSQMWRRASALRSRSPEGLRHDSHLKNSLAPCGHDYRILLQQYVRGVAASVSLISDGRRAVALSVNAQAVRASPAFSYRGGCTPLDHPLAGRAIEAAIRTCEALPNLRGYVGIDLVLTDAEAIVIEVNPRLTTAYLGVRSAMNGENIAAMAIDACRGKLPTPPRIGKSVQFTSSGRVVSTPLVPSSWFDGLTTSARS